MFKMIVDSRGFFSPRGHVLNVDGFVYRLDSWLVPAPFVIQLSELDKRRPEGGKTSHP